ncbi:MAG: glucose-1-phosphate adenylyltransferase [Acidobacteriota bacterium]
MQEIVCIVLGGGRGTRLFPLTYVRSKPAVPLGGKYRLIDIPISNCVNSGINKIFVLTQYNSESLNRHITQTYRFSMFSRGFVDILAAEQTHESLRWYQGTADAVRQSLRHVRPYGASGTLILSGDQLYRMDFRKVFRQHQARQADITVCVLPVGVERASGFGILKMEDDGRITDFYEKPKDPKLIEDLKVKGVDPSRPLMASMGIYLFQTAVLVDILKDETKLDFGSHVIPSALSQYRVWGYIFDDYWEDIGTIRAFYEANLDLTASKPKFNLYDMDAPIYTHPRFLPASRINNCNIRNSIVSEGCFVRDSTISGCVIGIRSIIREKTELIDSLVMGADYYEDDPSQRIPCGIGRGSSVRDAIVDKNARIGKNVRIFNRKKLRECDGENYYIRDGIVIIPKDALIEDGAVI